MPVPYYGDYPEDHTKVIIPFNAFTSDDPSASATITNFANTDVHIHKDAGVSPRNNAAGITVSINHDGITGNHVVTIDTSNTTVGGFWVTGKEYQVRIEGTTVDGATINAWIGSFSIERAGGVLALIKAGAIKVDLETIKTRAITCGAAVTVRADVGAAAAPGAANGMLIGGTNTATTFATLSITGQFDAGNVLVDGTTVFTGNTTFTGAVALSSTLGIAGAVTLSSTLGVGATTLASLSITGQLDAGNVLVDGTTVFTGTTTFTGAVALSSTLAIAGSTTLASLSVTGQLDAGNVLVDGTTVFTGTTTFTGAVTLSSTLGIAGAVTLSSTLGVTGVTTFTGAVNANITGDITGNLSGSVGSLTGHTGQSADNNTILAHSTYGNAKLATMAKQDVIDGIVDKVLALLNNKLTFVNSTGGATLRSVGDLADLATWTVTDDDTNTTRTEASWM